MDTAEAGKLEERGLVFPVSMCSNWWTDLGRCLYASQRILLRTITLPVPELWLA